MYDHTFYKLPNQQIRHQATHKVGCQPEDFAYGHVNLPQGFVWVCMGQYTHFVTPEGITVWMAQILRSLASFHAVHEMIEIRRYCMIK